jgi:two-component system response regulator HydG
MTVVLSILAILWIVLGTFLVLYTESTKEVFKKLFLQIISDGWPLFVLGLLGVIKGVFLIIGPSAQIKLLRVLQTQRFERVGGEQSLDVDVRIIAATNKELLQEVKNGRFREDLYYRLNVIPIHLPQLRERRNDIPLLARYFLRRFSVEQGKEIEEFSSETMRVLLDYSWPGNVRELENSIEHATVLAKGQQIEVSDLAAALNSVVTLGQTRRQPTISEHEKELLQQVLEECSWNKKEAAQRLGISRNTLYVKLKKYQITRPTKH